MAQVRGDLPGGSCVVVSGRETLPVSVGLHGEGVTPGHFVVVVVEVVVEGLREVVFGLLEDDVFLG